MRADLYLKPLPHRCNVGNGVIQYQVAMAERPSPRPRRVGLPALTFPGKGSDGYQQISGTPHFGRIVLPSFYSSNASASEGSRSSTFATMVKPERCANIIPRAATCRGRNGFSADGKLLSSMDFGRPSHRSLVPDVARPLARRVHQRYDLRAAESPMAIFLPQVEIAQSTSLCRLSTRLPVPANLFTKRQQRDNLEFAHRVSNNPSARASHPAVAASPNGQP